jgi:hypothetical protein
MTVDFGGRCWQGSARERHEGQSVIVKDIVRLAGWLARQDQALDNARRASTELSRRRVERDEVALYLDSLQQPSTDEWGGVTARTAD